MLHKKFTLISLILFIAFSSHTLHSLSISKETTVKLVQITYITTAVIGLRGIYKSTKLLLILLKLEHKRKALQERFSAQKTTIEKLLELSPYDRLVLNESLHFFQELGQKYYGLAKLSEQDLSPLTLEQFFERFNTIADDKFTQKVLKNIEPCLISGTIFLSTIACYSFLR